MQNKPNSQNPRIPTIPFTPKTYANIRLHPSQKNKPKQTQSRHTGKASRIEYPASSIQPCLCKTNPIPQRPKPTQLLMPHRFTAIFRSAPSPKNKPKQSQSPNAIRRQGPLRGYTQYAIRDTRYEPCTTAAGQP